MLALSREVDATTLEEVSRASSELARAKLVLANEVRAACPVKKGDAVVCDGARMEVLDVMATDDGRALLRCRKTDGKNSTVELTRCRRAIL